MRPQGNVLGAVTLHPAAQMPVGRVQQAAPYQATPDLHLTTPSPISQSSHNLQPAKSYKCMQLTPKTASVVPPEDERLTPETCRGSRHNKVIVKVKVY
jgi:hypothetical protein